MAQPWSWAAPAGSTAVEAVAKAAAAVSTPPLLQQPERLAARLKEVPAEPGCYLMRDSEDRILYIGKAKVLRQRVRSYFQSGSGHGHSPRIALMVRQVCELEFIVTDSEAEALALESNLIKHHQPHFNVLLKDDKKYPYLCITWSEAYPRIFITRQRRFRSPLDRFYGPYVDVGLLRRTLRRGEAGVSAAPAAPAALPRPHLPQLRHRPLPRGVPAEDQLGGLPPDPAPGGDGVPGPQRRAAGSCCRARWSATPSGSISRVPPGCAISCRASTPSRPTRR